MNTRELAEQFVETYNAAGSEVYPLYAPEVEWKEQPSGRQGGREQFFAALQAVRAKWDVSFVVQSVQEVGDVALINTTVSGAPVESGTAPMRTAVLWVLRFNKDGLIDLEYDYVYPPKDV